MKKPRFYIIAAVMSITICAIALTACRQGSSGEGIPNEYAIAANEPTNSAGYNDTSARYAYDRADDENAVITESSGAYGYAYNVSGESYANTEITALATTLKAHEAVLQVVSIDIPSQFYEGLPEYLASMGLEFRGEVIQYRIRYVSDAYEVIGYVAAPVDFMYYRYPILIYNRGGNRTFGSLREPGAVAELAAYGFIVMGSQYRGVAGGTGREQYGGDDINDVIRLIDISESFDFAQQGGVYMYGASRGGMMTYIATRIDTRIRAAAVWAAISDTITGFHEREPAMQRVYIDLIGGPPEDQWLYEYERRSAVLWANEINTPLLIGHGGEADWRVYTQHSINMSEALTRYGIPHRLSIFPDADHYWAEGFHAEMLEWFRMHPIEE